MTKNNIRLFSKTAFLVVFSIAALAPGVTGHAEDSDKAPLGYIGALLGVNTSSSSEGDMTTAGGLTVGAKLAPVFGIGFFGSYYGQNSSGSLLGLPTGASAKTIILAGQANYFIGGLHLGAEIGTAISSWSGHVSSLHVGDSASSIVFGPVAGYDFILGRFISLGVESHYLVSTTKGGVDNLQLFAALKLWQ